MPEKEVKGRNGVLTRTSPGPEPKDVFPRIELWGIGLAGDEAGWVEYMRFGVDFWVVHQCPAEIQFSSESYWFGENLYQMFAMTVVPFGMRYPS